jgi:hypothetical protein
LCAFYAFLAPGNNEIATEAGPSEIGGFLPAKSRETALSETGKYLLLLGRGSFPPHASRANVARLSDTLALLSQ